MRILRIFNNSGQACYNKYRSLKKQKLILDLKKIYKKSELKEAKNCAEIP